ncbi:MAG: ATP-grasp domain-containing protein [Candidatus Lokiarchaeota archaeon]|nr:ATP-grasp domain-containing protein [Candidatus Lokiarchaeota archaeon]
MSKFNDLLIISNNRETYETKRIIEELDKEIIQYNILSWNEITIPFNHYPKVCLIRSVPDFQKEFSLPYLLTFIEHLEQNGSICIPSSHDLYQADKASCLLIAKKNGILIPDFIIGEDLQQLSKFIKKHKKILYKPMIGSKGKGIKILSNDIDKELEIFSQINSIIYLQEFIENKKYDIRTIFIDNKMICQFIRENEKDFRYNISLGGKGHSPDDYIKMDPNLDFFLTESKKIGEILSNKMGLKIFGMDTIPSLKNKLYFLEINPILGFYGAEKATNVNIAKEIVQVIIKILK